MRLCSNILTDGFKILFVILLSDQTILAGYFSKKNLIVSVESRQSYDLQGFGFPDDPVWPPWLWELIIQLHLNWKNNFHHTIHFYMLRKEAVSWLSSWNNTVRISAVIVVMPVSVWIGANGSVWIPRWIESMDLVILLGSFLILLLGLGSQNAISGQHQN